ncbi:MAG: ATP-binding protein [Acidobacteriota bacterium]|nr:ATP-binding protein [Acidobacteriota bacterium]
MRRIPQEQVRSRMRAENPWWDGAGIRDDYARMKRRAYFARFKRLVLQTDVRRAVVLMGPRRVGKTVLLHHLIAHLLDGRRYGPRDIGYVSLDQPLYTRLPIEEIAGELREASGGAGIPRMLLLDEIQYLADWERHLKVFVDAHPEVRCVASGSAAAALRLKSIESGAGRFTDFLLPPLTFYEFLDLQNATTLVDETPGGVRIAGGDGTELNRQFVDYLNVGGYPEAVASTAVRADPRRYIGADIVEKVLLRDLPSLYGIQDVQELNALYTTLTYNTAGEVSLEGLSRDSGVTKPTLRRYLEYLEAAFLIRVVHRIDHNAHRFRRATRFKVYVTTPALRAALFGPVQENDDAMGALAESAVFAQWFHADVDLHYARWRAGREIGEVDLVHLDKRQKPSWCLDVKWSDRPGQRPDELASLANFARRHPDAAVLVTTRTLERSVSSWPGPGRLNAVPTSLYCYAVGRAVVRDPAAAPFWRAETDR